MTSLARLQQEFAAYVLQGSAEISGRIDDGGDTGVQQRIDVYREGYRLRLVEVLVDDYPGVQALVGDRDFDALCRAYIETRPSRRPNVRWYGDGLSVFLTDQAPWSERPALAEMARLEWALSLAFDAVDETTVTVAEAAGLDASQWPILRLRFAAHPQALSLRWNVDAVRRALDRGEGPPVLAEREAALGYATWRRDRAVFHRPLTVDEAAVLEAARGGADFSALCSLLCAWTPEDQVAQRAAELFKGWIEQQWITALIVEPEHG